MAKWIIYTAEQEQELAEWMASRPAVIQEMAKKHNLRPDTLYKLRNNRVVLYSMNEDGTVMVNILHEFNPEFPFFVERTVFGVDPADLVECDLPEMPVHDDSPIVDIEFPDVWEVKETITLPWVTKNPPRK